jgi:hypothetical protein
MFEVNSCDFDRESGFPGGSNFANITTVFDPAS